MLATNKAMEVGHEPKLSSFEEEDQLIKLMTGKSASVDVEDLLAV